MATLAELRALILDIVPNDDAKFDSTDIDGYINRGVNEISNGMQSTLGSFITPPLPNLFTTGTVTTSTTLPYVVMPTNFQRGLQFASDSSGVEIDIANSMIEFAENYPLMNQSGSVEEVIEQGGNLYYQRIPTVAVVITLHYYKAPTALIDVAHVPSSIPSHLQVPLIVNYACKEMFTLIEDGMKGPQVNTERYTEKFLSALRTLELSIPFDTRSLKLIGE
jgi:hypothetical protein